MTQATQKTTKFGDYRKLRREREQISDEYRVMVTDFQSEYTEELQREWIRIHGKRRKFPKDWARVMELANYRAITAMYTGAGLQWLREWELRRDRLEGQLTEMAGRIEIETLSEGRELVQVDWVYSGAYRSQGFGCMKYARESAQSKADKGTFYGLKTEIRLIGKDSDCGYGIHIQDYGIFANTDADGWDVVQRRPGVPLRDWIKGCWSRGVNPRVYNPWLPWGIEERMGLDYQGGEVRKGSD